MSLGEEKKRDIEKVRSEVKMIRHLAEDIGIKHVVEDLETYEKIFSALHYALRGMTGYLEIPMNVRVEDGKVTLELIFNIPRFNRHVIRVETNLQQDDLEKLYNVMTQHFIEYLTMVVDEYRDGIISIIQRIDRLENRVRELEKELEESEEETEEDGEE